MLELIQIPAWRDNYAYFVVNGRRAFVVDAPEAAPVLARLAALPGVVLEAVVNTHHHGDHIGGNEALVAATGCAVVANGADRDRIEGVTGPATCGETIDVAGVPLFVLDVQAHTSRHVAYRCALPFDRVHRHGHDGVEQEVAALAGRPALFVGDSLFTAGCGRLFEGTTTDLAKAMRTLAREDSRSLVACGHEYTAANLKFARLALPDVAAIAARQASLDVEKGATGSSVPAPLALELETNPFLLGLRDDVRAELATRLNLASSDAATVIGALRHWKDQS